MKSRLITIFLVVSLIVMAFSIILPQSLAEDTVLSYNLINLYDGTFSYKLNVVVPESLVEYYRGLSHVSASSADFSKFVTPYPVKPIADCMRTIYPDDEDFTNAVLSLVTQIPYEVITPAFYPLEILVRNSGDCDLFSFLAASILKAGGLEVVLLHYPTEEHMNIGVHLANPPQAARLSVFSVKDRNNIEYYIAETTSEGWRVGESPQDLQDATAIIIPIPADDVIAPGQVSASFTELIQTNLTLDLSPAITIEGSEITTSGQIYPTIPNQNVTIYISQDGTSWQIQGYSSTDDGGHFSYSWIPDYEGSFDVRASWPGNSRFAGTISSTKNSIILPIYLLAIILIAIFSIAICIVALIKSSKNRQNQSNVSSEFQQAPRPSPDETNLKIDQK